MTVPRFDVTGFGEIMLRLSVPSGRRLEATDSFAAHPGGAEGNVLCALGALGRKGAWVGGLPDNPLGALVRNHLRRSNVATEGVIWKKDGRLGTFYIEFSGPPRGIQVYYDRSNSAAAEVTTDDLPWSVLLDTTIIHISGISPALSESSRKATREIVARAREKQIPVSFDVNYRKKLWSINDARETILPLVEGVELLFCNRADAETLFGCTGDPEDCLHALLEKTGAKNAVMSLGDVGAIGWDGRELFRAAQQPVAIVDRIGAGDAMAAGVLHGWLDGDLRRGLDVGMVLAAIALSVEGDTVYTSPEEVEALLANIGTGGGLHR